MSKRPSITSKKISILPDRSLMPKIGQTNYSVSQAIAELVDNSIDARPQNKLLTVQIIIDEKNKKLEVSDDGIGMDEQTAANSIKLAHSAKKNKLGEFGLGMKTAATSLGKGFQIYTTQANSDKEYVLEYDEDNWLREGDWTEYEIKIKSGVEKNKSGTTIKITGIRFNVYPNLSGNVRKDLSERFAPFIENGEVKIKVNTKWCTPEPVVLKEEYFPPDGKEHFAFKVESGNEVRGWRGLMKKGSHTGQYGFRVFRRGRLILPNAKLGFTAHPEIRQIYGEIHLDHVPVTHNKREFIEESPLWRELNEEGGIFWDFMRELVKEARSSSRKTQIDQGVVDKMALQKENIMRAIKNTPQLKEYAFPDIKEKLKSDSKNSDGFDLSEIERRDKREMVSIEEDPTPNDSTNRKPKKTQIRKNHYIWINGKKFKIEHDFVDLKSDDIMKDKTVDDVNGIAVFTNIAFPGFANTNDHVFYGAWHIAEAIAEVMVEKNNRSYDEVVKIRDVILKKSAQITRELDQVEQERKVAERLKREYEEQVAKLHAIESRQAK